MSEQRPDVSLALLPEQINSNPTKLQPAEAYSLLRAQFTRIYELQSGFPVDGSSKDARAVSPFTISLVPPLFFENLSTTVAPPEPTGDGLKSFSDDFILAADEQILGAEQLYGLVMSPFNGNAGAGLPIESSSSLPEITVQTILDGANEADVPSDHLDNMASLAVQLNKIQQRLGAPLYFAGYGLYRTPAKNEATDGAENSQHLLGKAADIKVQGLNANKVHAVLNVLMDSGELTQGGLGWYPTFTHYDIRGGRARWPLESKIPPESKEEGVKFANEFFNRPVNSSSENTRLQREIGFLRYQQQRSNPKPYDSRALEILSAASGGKYNNFYEAKIARQEAVLYAIGHGVGGQGISRNLLETFIANGKAKVASGQIDIAPAIANEIVAADIALQLDSILRTPPLTLLINPQNFSINFTRIHQYSQAGRTGYIYEAWGIDQPVISISGRCGAFIAGVNPASGVILPGQPTPSVSGVQFASKRDSAAWQNLMNLFLFYRNNGYILDSRGAATPQMVGALAIHYDGWTFVGNINSFSYGYDENETQNGNVSFEMEFQVIQMFDSSQTPRTVVPLQDPTGGTNLGRVADQLSSLAPFQNLPLNYDPIGDSSTAPPSGRVDTPEPGKAQKKVPENSEKGTQGFVPAS